MKLLLILLFVSLSGTPSKEKSLVVKEKTIVVKGRTSVGKFHCSFNVMDACDTLFLNNNQKQLGFILPVKAFGCGNFLINRDFQATLNAEVHPEIHVEVSNMRKVGAKYFGDLRLKLAGTTKDLLNVEFESNSSTVCKSLKTDLILQFSQFDLNPPKKFGGLIKVENDLAITVALEVDEI